MGRYTPTINPTNRRRRLIADANPHVVRITMLGIFMMLLGFFVALCAATAPNDEKTINLLTTLQSTFKPLQAGEQELRASVPVPSWLKGGQQGQDSPLTDMRALFPEAFVTSTDPWGSVELHFTADRFQTFILNHSDLAENFMSGFAAKRTHDDDFMLEIAVGLKGIGPNPARVLGQKIKREVLSMGVHPTRLLMGVDTGAEGVTIRITQADRYEGAF